MTAPIGLGDISSAVNVGPVSGTQYDLGYMIANGSIEAWAKYKPVYHSATAYVTLAQRRAIFHGLTPYNMESILNYHLGIGNGSTSVTSTFSSVPTPSAWTYTKPSGGIGTAPYRTFDFLHIENDTSQIQSMTGYFKNAKPPISLKSTTANINLGSTKAPVEYDLFNFDENGSSIYTCGDTTGMEIKFNELLPHTAFGSNFDEPFFKEGGSRVYNYTWQFAIAVACKVSASAYVWVIVSSVDSFGDYWMDVNWTQAQLFNHRICFGSDMAAGAYNAIATAIRNYGQTDFICVPFVAQNLYYNSTTGIWYFATGSSTAKAITFPKGDYFTAYFDGINSTMTMGYRSPWLYDSYTISFSYAQAYTGFYMTIPVPASASTSKTFSLNFSFTGYGRNTNFQAGINGNVGSVTLRDASSNIITTIGTSGASSVTLDGNLSFSTAAISALVYSVPSSVSYIDSSLVIQWYNSDIGRTVTRNYPLRINISR